MATYNFRVRAEDSFGALASREFSMEVRNTRRLRYLTLTSSGMSGSFDGLTWNAVSSGGGNSPGNGIHMTGNYLPVAHGGGVWMQWDGNGGTGGGGYRTSPDGQNWTARFFSPTRPTSPTAVSITQTAATPRWMNNRWHMSCASGTTFFCVTSTDGVSWSTLQDNLPNNAAFEPAARHSMRFGNGTYVIGNNVSTTGTAFWTTTNLTSLTPVTPTGITGARTITDVQFFNGTWFFVDGATTTNARIFWSNNLTSFNQATVVSSLPAQCQLDCLYYGNGRLLLTTRKNGTGSGSLNTVYTSDNGGITWTARTFPALINNTTTQGAMMGGWLDGQFIFGSTSTSAGLRTSPDGINWSTPTLTGYPATTLMAGMESL